MKRKKNQFHHQTLSILLFLTMHILVFQNIVEVGGQGACNKNMTNNGDLGSECVTLLYGDPDPPTTCQPRTCIFERTTYFESYVCSTQNLEAMTQTFLNPLPEDTQLISFQVVLYGRFQCDASGPSTVLVLTLNNEFIAAGQISNPTVGCSCPNCATELAVPNSSLALTSYHYGNENNTLTLRVLEGQMCISAAEITLIYSEIPPTISSLFPQSAPDYGGNLITVLGDKFYPSDTLLCAFNSVYVPAIYVNETSVTCETPPDLEGLIWMKITENNITFSSQVSFYFYPPFNITYVKNLKGSAKGGTFVRFYGTNFQDSSLQKIVCRFGDIDVPAPNSNSTNIECKSPELANWTSHLSEIRVPLYLSQNGVNFNFTGHFFTYVRVPTQPLQFAVWQWVVIVLICMTLLAFLVGGVIFLRWIISQKRPSARSKLPGSPSDPLLSRDYSAYGSNNFPIFTSSFNNIDLSEISDMKLIEKGSFGLIYKGTWEGSTVAIKKLPSGKMTPAFIEELEQEAEIMRQLRHPNILNFIGTSCDLDGRQICIVMEYMDRGSLYRLIHDHEIQFTLDQMKSICIDAARGINYLHNLNPPIIHRDLKSHNLLINSDGIVKVCDFGLSRFIESTLAGTMTACGTPSWTAPEVLRNERYSFKIDVYSFGIVIWELFARQDPYPGMPPFQIVFAVGSQSARPVVNPEWPAGWIKLMTRCWAENPDHRPTMEQILHCLQRNCQ